MEFLIIQSYSASCYFLPLRCKYLPLHLVLRYLQFIRIVCPFNERDKVSEAYKTTDKATL
jgi:hypothetical protein